MAYTKEVGRGNSEEFWRDRQGEKSLAKES